MALPRRTPWQCRLAALVALLGLVLGTQALLAPGADAVPQPPPCDVTPALTQCATGTGSTSAAGSAALTAPAGAKATATAFMVTPSGPVFQGTPVILVAQVSPANATGTIQFNDGDTELGMPRPVIGGFALTVTSKLATGTHSLTAVFTAADQTAFGPSMPPPVSLTVIGLS